MCDSVWKYMWVRQFIDYLYFSKRSARRMVSQAVDLSGLTRLKNEFQSKYIVSPYNIRTPTLWISLDDWILGCQKGVSQDNAYTTSNKSFGVQKLTPQIEGRWTVIKMITVGKAQWTKRLLRSVFYWWCNQWILSESVKVQQRSDRESLFRSSPRFVGRTKLLRVDDGFLWCYASYDGKFYGISLFCD